ncbi:MAG: ribonuclease HII [Myxococcales bacterium]|nr:ribonuclease HII [Myxococcales bacterium]
MSSSDGVEQRLFEAGFDWIIGVDEAGRGPLAGPVSVGAVLVRRVELSLLQSLAANDSKAMTAALREQSFFRLQHSGLVHATVHRSPRQIDELNILGATLSAMFEAVTRCWSVARPAGSGLVVVDGNQAIPGLPLQQITLVRGDARSRVIGTGSILAKVERDSVMDSLHLEHAEYGFDRNRGYPTPEHLRALQRLGPCPHHRLSFAPVRKARVDVDSSSSV